MTSVARLGYVILYVDNMDATLKYYSDVFGLKEKMRQGPYAEVSTGATTLAFSEREFVTHHLGLTPGPKGQGSSEIALVVSSDELTACYQRALSAGGTSVAEPKKQAWGQVISYVRDPNGHLIEICTPTD
jgi:lactoylglutathione lyase